MHVQFWTVESGDEHKAQDSVLVDELAARFPLLFHMAAPNSWDSIKEHGLLSTSRLLDLFDVEAPIRRTIEEERRPEMVYLRHPALGVVAVRDNKPLSDGKLQRCLSGMTMSEFYLMLNARVFFWLTERRLETLLSARAYRDRQHTIIRVDTRKLLDRHHRNVTLSPINSGSTVYSPQPRGPDTFKPIADYDFDLWRRRRTAATAIAELAVDSGVPDIAEVAVSVEHRRPDGSRVLLWRRS